MWYNARMSNDIIFPADFRGIHIHFVGIKGTGCTALVEILASQGAIITGSDVRERFYTDEILEKYGLHALDFSEDNITDDVRFVVYSSAYSKDKNPDLIAAVKKGVPCLLYSEALGKVSEMAYSAGVCGVHGKTTTTGLCGTILKGLHLNAQVLAGSVIKSFGDSCVMTNLNANNTLSVFVAETCEYQRHFMAFCPKKIILTSVESDHQDYYPTYEDIRNAFVDYCLKLPEGEDLIYCADDAGACEVAGIVGAKRPDIKKIPYGTTAAGDYRITIGGVEDGTQLFSVGNFGEFALCVPGVHNIRNATAAIALSIALLKEDGQSIEDNLDAIKTSLRLFAGGKRRSEITGRATTERGDSVVFIDDYGHHPTAVKTTLEGYCAFYPNRRIIVDFMSHTYTRTAALLEEFAACFSSADCVVINKIYGSAREDEAAANVTGETLAEHAAKYHANVHYKGEFDEAAAFIFGKISKKCPARDGYLVVTMGAGDNWKVGKKVLEMLGARK